MKYSQAVVDRFQARLGVKGDCRPWNGRQRPSGHGLFDLGKGKIGQAHRVAYEILVGPIPKTMVVAQTCGWKCCCAIDHLELITQSQASLRGRVGTNMIVSGASQTHCKRGHSLENAYTRSNNKRQCVKCHKITQRRRRNNT